MHTRQDQDGLSTPTRVDLRPKNRLGFGREEVLLLVAICPITMAFVPPGVANASAQQALDRVARLGVNLVKIHQQRKNNLK